MIRLVPRAVLLLGLLAGAAWGAQQETPSSKEAKINSSTPALRGEPDQVEEAIVRTLDYLEGQQHLDGHWENAHRVQRRWATAWSVLAYLANGQTARAGNYQDTVKKGLAFLARSIEQPFTRAAYGDDGPLVNALCLFTLLSALGQGTEETQDEDLLIVCERQVQTILQNQRRNQEGNEHGKLKSIDAAFVAGGWGAVPLSYWNTLCLAAARHCGIKIPRIVLDDLRAFWKRHYVVAFGSYYDQVAYTYRSADRNHGVTLTIPCVLVLCLLGERESAEVQGALETLRSVRPGDPEWFWEGDMHRRSFSGGKALLLSQWYQAMKLVGAGSHELSRWRTAYSAHIINDQSENGSFRFPGWDRMEEWSKRSGDKQFGMPTWHEHTLGYGGNWSEANLAAHAAFGLALPKAYLPVFKPWEKP